MIRRKHLPSLRTVLRWFWFRKVLRRKRDIVKDNDCKDYLDSGVDMHRFIKNGVFDRDGYIMEVNRVGKGWVIRNCWGDGHYMCMQCKRLDYDESDLVPSQLPEDEPRRVLNTPTCPLPSISNCTLP